MRRPLVCVAVFFALSCTALTAFAQDDGSATYAGTNPDKGPPEPFIYRNPAIEGVFKLSQGVADGTAKYFFQNRQNNDTLKFIGFGELSDTTGVGVPAGQTYDVWMYEASDAQGNVWYLALGTEPLGLNGPKRYGLYYSYKDPRTTGNKMKRWLSQSGTSRE